MTDLLHGLIGLLIPMGIFPAMVALVLGRHVNSPSTALKDRARLALLLGLVGLVVSAMAAKVTFGLGVGMVWLWFGFVLLMIAVDVASAIWLITYFRGGFARRD